MFALIARGLSNDDIARELVVSEATVKTHVNRLIAKLGNRSRVQLVVLGLRDGDGAAGCRVAIKLSVCHTVPQTGREHPGPRSKGTTDMTPTIRVDDEVYALLQERGEAFVDTPNTVLRRILGLTESGESTGNPVAAGRPPQRGTGEPRARQAPSPTTCSTPRRGARLAARDNGERHTARVGADGTLHLEDGHVADSPSAAARHLAGYEVRLARVAPRPTGPRSPTSGARAATAARRRGHRGEHGGRGGRRGEDGES